LIDDIQYIIEKEKTAEEVFNTFEALYNSGKQMVFASTIPPKDILGINERLQRRLAMGLLVDLKSPSYETRIEILKSKARINNVQEGEGLSEVASFIAEHITTDARDLEAAFNRVVFYAKVADKPITKTLAEEVLKDEVNIPISLSGEYNKGVEKFIQNNSHIYIAKPKRFDECPKLADTLKSDMPIIVNLEHVENDTARKIFDFLSGVTYGINGNVIKIAQNLFVFLPESVDNA